MNGCPSLVDSSGRGKDLLLARHFSPAHKPVTCQAKEHRAPSPIQRQATRGPGDNMPASMGLRACVAFFLAASALTAQAQGFPDRAIRVIVPYPAGGATDAVIRPVANSVSAALGQPVLIDNRPGGNTFIGMNACAKAPPDGYTLCVTNSDTLAFGPLIFNKIPYDPATQLVGITKLADTPGGVFISAQLPFSTFEGMIAYARANPGKLSFASFGTGTVGHLYAEWFRRQLNADMMHVPYRGAAPIVPALINNEAQVTYLALSMALPHIRTGKIKAVAIADAGRSSQLPDVPTLAELKADPGINPYFGLYAPAGTPAAVLERLNHAFTAALRESKVKESMSGLLFVTVPTTVAEINRSRKEEAEAAAKVTKIIGLKPLDLPE
jgi:tripartite-type tricarboxylate transporter receptor subunit TctC